MVLPIGKEDGMPISHSFTPETLEDIETHLTHTKSTTLYAVMAQPAIENVPPFVLQIFGSDNTFKTVDVLKRQEHTKEKLKK